MSKSENRRDRLELELKALQKDVDSLTEKITLPSNAQPYGKSKVSRACSNEDIMLLAKDNEEIQTKLYSLRNERRKDFSTNAQERARVKTDILQQARDAFSPSERSEMDLDLDSELEDAGLNLQDLRLSPDEKRMEECGAGQWGGGWRREANAGVISVGSRAKVIRAKRALADMTRQRDAAVERVKEAESDAERLKERLRQAEHALHLLEDLQKDYDMLKQNFEASERMRLKQKELIHSLQMSQKLAPDGLELRHMESASRHLQNNGRIEHPQRTETGLHYNLRLHRDEDAEELLTFHDPVAAATKRIKKELSKQKTLSPCLTTHTVTAMAKNRRGSAEQLAAKHKQTVLTSRSVGTRPSTPKQRTKMTSLDSAKSKSCRRTSSKENDTSQVNLSLLSFAPSVKLKKKTATTSAKRIPKNSTTGQLSSLAKPTQSSLLRGVHFKEKTGNIHPSSKTGKRH